MNERFFPADSGVLVAAPLGDHELHAQRWEASDGKPSFELKVIIRVLYRWRWLALGLAALILAAVIAYTALQTPLYRASATLQLDPAPAKVVDSKESYTAPLYDPDFLALQIGLIKSRSVAERVARRLKLGQDEAFLGGPAPAGAKPEDAIGTLMGNFVAAGTTSDRIMSISYSHPNPTVAAKVVNEFAEQAIANTFERSNEATARSRQYLQMRLAVTRQELEQSERELINYARAAKIVNVASEDGPTNKDAAGGTLLAGNVIALNAQLAEAQNARIAAQARNAEARGSANSAVAADPTGQALRQQRAQLQAEYDQKATQYRRDYPELTDISGRLAGLDRQIAQASERAARTMTGGLSSDYDAARLRESLLEKSIAQLQSRLLDLNDRGVRYTILQRAVEANRSMYNALLNRLGEENSSATRTSSVALIDAAQAPGAPFSPNFPRALLLGLIAGLAVGVAGALAAEKWMDTISLPEDLRELLGLPVLGVIPRAGPNEDLDELIADAKSQVSEAYHSARAHLQYLSSSGAPRSILITSARAGEGKTSTTIAIATDFASVGRRVVVIDADLRRPSLRGSPGNKGFSGLLTGAATISEVLNEAETPNLYLIPAGVVPPNPTVLLDSALMANLVRELEERFDVVVIDGPPVIGLADAPLLARVAEATVVVVESGKTHRGAVRDAMQRLRTAGASVVGGILTKLDRKSAGYSDHTYEYFYSYKGASEGRTRPLSGLKFPERETAVE